MSALSRVPTATLGWLSRRAARLGAVGWIRPVILSALVLFSWLVYEFALGKGVLADPFHTGEYFALFTSRLHPPSGIHPLTLHGAIDYIPAWIAYHIYGSDDYFLPTVAIVRVLGLVAALLLFLVAREVIGPRRRSFVPLAFCALTAPLLTDRRDVLVLLALWAYLLAQRMRSQGVRLVIFTGAGCLVALGLFYSYDRGLAGLVALGVAFVLQLRANKEHLAALVGFLGSVLVLMLLSSEFSPATYVTNLRILFSTSAQWSYGWNSYAAGLVFSALVLLGLVTLLLQRRRHAHTTVGSVVVLTVLSLAFAKLYSNRADWGHVVQALWSQTLLFFYVLRLHEITPFSTTERRIVAFGGVAWVAVVGAILLSSQNSVVVLFFLCICVAACIGIRGRGFPIARSGGVPTALAAVCFAGAFAFLLAQGLRSVVLALGALGLGGALALYGRRKGPGAEISAYKARLAVLLLVVVMTGYWGVSALRAGTYSEVDRLADPPQNAELATDGVRWAAEQLVAAGARSVFDLSNSGVINGLTGLPSTSRFVYPVYADSGYEDELIDAVRTQRPAAIVYSSTYWSYVIDGRSMSARFPRLDAFLRANYALERSEYGYTVRLLTGAGP